ncbi:MAG: hypothetical protein CVU52_07395, partial [Deltaproteobacteria bacterium HGW-Deltaproteobacteria-10]
MYYSIIKAGKDEIGLVWQIVGGKTLVEYIYLPEPAEILKDKISKEFPEAKKAVQKIPGGIAGEIAKIYAG